MSAQPFEYAACALFSSAAPQFSTITIALTACPALLQGQDKLSGLYRPESDANHSTAASTLRCVHPHPSMRHARECPRCSMPPTRTSAALCSRSVFVHGRAVAQGGDTGARCVHASRAERRAEHQASGRRFFFWGRAADEQGLDGLGGLLPWQGDHAWPFKGLVGTGGVGGLFVAFQLVPCSLDDRWTLARRSPWT